MLESIHPGHPQFRGIEHSNQSFDLVIKNHSGRDLDRLVVIHPRRLYSPTSGLPRHDSDASQLDVPSWEATEWYGRRMHSKERLEIDHKRIRFGLRTDLRSPARVEIYSTHAARLVDPARVRPHSLLVDDAEVRQLFEKHPLLPCVLEVELEEPLRPYVPQDPDTVHYVRLNFRQVGVKPVSAYKIPLPSSGSSGRNDEYLLKQVFAIMAPQLVWTRLETRLRHISETSRDGSERAAANRLLKEVVEDGFRSPEKTVRVRDHRLGIVVPDGVHFEAREFGRLLPFEVRELTGETSDTTEEERARIWLAGPTVFPEEDPYLAALNITRHMLQHLAPGATWDYTEVGIAIAAGCSVHNATLVLETLEAIGVVQHHPPAWRLAPPPAGVDFHEWKDEKIRELQTTGWEIQIRRQLANAWLDGRAFNDQPFVLQFSVVGRGRGLKLGR